MAFSQSSRHPGERATLPSTRGKHPSHIQSRPRESPGDIRAPYGNLAPEMNPEARAEMVAHAERALRRGELSEALSLYETLCRAFPEDPALALKLSNLRETLQPQELQALQALQASARPEAIPQGPSSPAAEGERLFSLGDY